MGGSILALPSMESLAVGPAKGVAQRMAFYYAPIGVVRRTFFPGEENGVTPLFNRDNFEADETKTNLAKGEHPLELTATLKPLERVKDKVSLITGMDRTFQPGTDVHAQCASCFLSSASPFSVKHSPYPQARTLDHIVAEKIGTQTPFKTLEFSCNSHKDNKESIQFDNISWYGTEYVAPSMRDPLLAYRRLFKSDERSAYRNITDLVLEDARSLKARVGSGGPRQVCRVLRLDTHHRASTLAIGGIEGRIEQGRPRRSDGRQASPGEYIRLMGDLMVVALQSGLTNAATFMVGPERWDTPYLFESLFDKPRSHHQMSHNQKKFIEDLSKVDYFYMEQFAYLLQKMDGIQEANGKTLLDNTLFTYGSGLGDGATHQYSALPIVTAGSGGGKFKTGRHFNLSEQSGLTPKVGGRYVAPEGGVPLANLWLTQARALGLKMDRFADSTGELGILRA